MFAYVGSIQNLKDLTALCSSRGASALADDHRGAHGGAHGGEDASDGEDAGVLADAIAGR